MQRQSPLGPVPDDWNLVRLKDIVTKVGSGATPKGGQEVYLPARLCYALIRSQNVFDRWFDPQGLVFISDEHANDLRGAQVQPGDVLLNITGDGVTFSRACIVPEEVLPACVNQHVSIIRVDRRKCHPQFLLSYLTHSAIKSYIESFNSGGSRRAVTKGHIDSFELPLPPVPVQEAIASILGSLDDKIECNRRMNRTLEAIARALFKSWFVDFDPVRAKADGRTPAGMDAATAALFPDHFVDSELGKIPSGWKPQTIGEVVRCVGGATPSTKVPSYWDGEIPFATPKDLAGLSDPVLLTTERCITALGLEQIGSGLLPKGSVLLSSRAPIGYLAIAEVPVAVNQGFVAMLCDGPLPNHYVLHWTRENMDAIVARANGTTFLEISKANFRPIDVLVPPPMVLEKFVDIVAPLHARIVANLKESRTLAALRDTLLPKLISGELRVPDAEKRAGEVA